jgi:hypothetical protein
MRLSTHQIVKLFSIFIILGDLRTDVWDEVSWRLTSSSDTHCSKRSPVSCFPRTILLLLFLLPPLFVPAATAVLTNGARVTMVCRMWLRILVYQCPSPAVGWSARPFIVKGSKWSRRQQRVGERKVKVKGLLYHLHVPLSQLSFFICLLLPAIFD